MIKSYILICIVSLLGGCATTQVATPVEVKIPVPVKCTAETPLKPTPVACYQDTGKDNWKEDFVVNTKCLIHEIDVREAYEIKLLANFESCK